MKILFVRHGESKDDLINAYGGWADFHLTENGKTQINNTAKKIKNLDIEFVKILSSPLIRAKESSEIISKELNIPIEIFEYVKERNTYGILCGMEKEEARQKYPWLVEAYDKGEYVEGSERIDDIDRRSKRAFDLIKNMSISNVLVLTHGNFLKSLFPQVLNKKVTKKDDGGFILLEVRGDNSQVLIEDGIEIG